MTDHNGRMILVDQIVPPAKPWCGIVKKGQILRIIDIELPEKPYRLDSDSAVLPKLREPLGKGRISVTPKRDGTVRVTVPRGVIILTP